MLLTDTSEQDSAWQIRRNKEMKKSLKVAFEADKAIVVMEPHQEMDQEEEIFS